MQRARERTFLGQKANAKVLRGEHATMFTKVKGAKGGQDIMGKRKSTQR